MSNRNDKKGKEKRKKRKEIRMQMQTGVHNSIAARRAASILIHSSSVFGR